MMMNRLISILLGATLFLPLIVVDSNAGIEPSPFMLSGAADNESFWVLFNPQPEPPGLPPELRLNTTNPLAPVFTLVEPNSSKFELLMGFYGPTKRISYNLKTDPSNALSFNIYNGDATAPQYTATFSFSSPGSDVMFNPQPEPPGSDPFKYFTFIGSKEKPLSVGMDIEMTLRITDADDKAVGMTSTVPEPGTMMTLLGLGMAGLAFYGRRIQNKKA